MRACKEKRRKTSRRWNVGTVDTHPTARDSRSSTPDISLGSLRPLYMGQMRARLRIPVDRWAARREMHVPFRSQVSE